MKKLLALAILIANQTLAQLPTKDGHVFYEMIDTTSLSKEAAYSKAKLWLVNSFKNAKSVIQIDDKETGQIVGHGSFPFKAKFGPTPTKCECFFTVKIDVKDSKYRIQFYSIYVMVGEYDVPYQADEMNEKPDKSVAKKTLPEIDKIIPALIDDFKITMAEKVDSF